MCLHCAESAHALRADTPAKVFVQVVPLPINAVLVVSLHKNRSFEARAVSDLCRPCQRSNAKQEGEDKNNERSACIHGSNEKEISDAYRGRALIEVEVFESWKMWPRSG
jgi:hypothetical protein